MIPFKTPYNRIGLSLLDFCENGEQPDGSTYFDAIMTRALVACAAVDGSPRGRVLQVPRGDYLFARQINIDCQVIMVGEASYFGDYGSGTQFTFDAGNDGLVFHRPNTSPSGGRGDGAIICGIGVNGTPGPGVHHGVRFYARGLFMQGSVGGFDGDCFHITNIPAVANDWAPSTAYTVGQQRYNDGRLYVVTVAGTSALSGGPTGTGSGIVDGGVLTWDYVSTYAGIIEPLDPIAAWAPSTAYRIGDAVNSDTGRVYLCVQEGVSSAGTGPTGTGSNIVDDGCKWNYINGTNANGWQIDLARFGASRNGVYVFGGDSNSGCVSRFDIVGCSDFAFYDESFLGNKYANGQIAACAGGSFKVTNANGACTFEDVYVESDTPAAQITARTRIVGAFPGNGISSPNVGFFQDGQRINMISMSVNGSNDAMTLGGPTMQAIGGASFYNSLAKVPYSGTPTGVQGVARWNWAGLTAFDGHGQALDSQAIFQVGSELARYMNPTQLYAGLGFGMMIEGKRISFCDSTSRPGLGFGGPVTDAEGDYIFKRAAVIGESAGWVCIEGGTSSTYAEGLTATSAGGTSLTLSGNTHVTHGLQIGDRVLINGVDTYVTNRGIGPTTSITVADAIPAGSGLAITYVPGVYGLLPQIETAIQDDSGSPSTTYTQDATAGKFVIMSGEHVVIVNNAYCTTDSIITCSLQTLDAGIAGHYRVACGGGVFIFETNSNAVADVVVSWVLRN